MANVIELVNKYLPMLDEQYRLEAKSSILDVAPEFIQQTKEAKKVKIAKISVDGLADYSRQGGFTAGSMELTWEEHEFRIDRGRALQVDAMDNLETFGLAWGRLAGTFQKEKVIPEMDAYRFAQYYINAGIKREVALSSANFLKTIDDLCAIQDEREVPEDGKIIFVNPTEYVSLVNDKTITRNLAVDETLTGVLKKKIYSYNGMPIIKVPSNRFYTEIELLTGSGGEVVGGYTPASGAKTIAFMLISKAAVIQISKRLISRFWAPTRAEMDTNSADGVNPTHDAWKFDYRTYHDAWVLENKVYGIAAVINVAEDVEAAKATKLSELDGILVAYDENDYTPENWTALNKVITDAKEEVEALTTVAEVEAYDLEAVATACNLIPKISETLATAKALKVAQLDGILLTYDENDYTPENWTALTLIITNAKEAVNLLTTIAEVEAYDLAAIVTACNLITKE